MISAVALRFWPPAQKRKGASLRKQESFSSAAAEDRLGGPLGVWAARCAQTPSAILATSSGLLPTYCAGAGGAGGGAVTTTGSADTARSLTSLKSGSAAVRCTE